MNTKNVFFYSMLSGSFEKSSAKPFRIWGSANLSANLGDLYDENYMPKKKPVYTIKDGELFDPISGILIKLEDLIYSRVDPTDKNFVLSAFDIARIKGDNDAILSMANNLLANDPDDVNALSHKAFALAMGGDLEGALALNTRALQIDPQCPGLLNNRALDLLHLGRAEEALIDIQASIKLDPGGFIPSYGILARTLFKLGRESEGLDAIEAGLKLQKEGALVPFQRAHLAGIIGCEKPEEALEKIRKLRSGLNTNGPTLNGGPQ